MAQTVKYLPAVGETWIQSPGWEDPLEEGMAIHSGILAWRIPWTEEPGVSEDPAFLGANTRTTTTEPEGSTRQDCRSLRALVSEVAAQRNGDQEQPKIK